jgi:hypothetical protein
MAPGVSSPSPDNASLGELCSWANSPVLVRAQTGADSWPPLALFAKKPPLGSVERSRREPSARTALSAGANGAAHLGTAKGVPYVRRQFQRSAPAPPRRDAPHPSGASESGRESARRVCPGQGNQKPSRRAGFLPTTSWLATNVAGGEARVDSPLERAEGGWGAALSGGANGAAYLSTPEGVPYSRLSFSTSVVRLRPNRRAAAPLL